LSRPANDVSPSGSERFRKTRAKASHAESGHPACPRSLSKPEKQRFKQICRELESRRALTPGDGELIVLYCRTWTRWLKALGAVAGSGGEVVTSTRIVAGVPIETQRKNPWLLVAQESEKQMRCILVDLGFTPTSRERAKAIKEAPKEEPDELEKLLMRRRVRNLRVNPFTQKLETAEEEELPS
jgi:P27 family predicted phage terminase small subunit